MKIENEVRARAATLIKRGSELARIPTYPITPPRKIVNECEGWIVSAMNLLGVIHPNLLSPYQLRASIVQNRVHVEAVGGLVEILKSLIEDVDAGVITRVADAATAEVFDDFLDQAAFYLNGKKKMQAGVIAGVVFEDTIRRACTRRKISEQGVDLEQLITALRNVEAFSEVKAKRARAAAGVRTKATHAQWDEFAISDVEAVITLTREFIDTLLT